MSADRENPIVLGVIAGAHGIRGAVKLKSFTQKPAAIGDYGVLQSRAGPLDLVSLKPAKAGFIAEFKQITDRNQAEAMTGVELTLPRGRLPEPEEDEFYHADLIGLEVRLEDGSVTGRIKAIQDFGAGDLLEIRFEEGGTDWVPFTGERVPEINVADGYVIIHPTETEE